MAGSLECVKERFTARRGSPDKNEANLTLWNRIKSAIEGRRLLSETNEFETDDGYICLLDGKRVGFLSEYVRYRFEISWSLYCSLFDVPNGYPRFSLKYLKAYHEKAFMGRSRPQFAVNVEESLSDKCVRSMIDGTEKYS